MDFLTQISANLTRGPYFEHDSNGPAVASDPLVRLIAFYLPQFHPIPENDRVWGKGFTEWTNVSKALPRFVGHYQPHLPGELGFYDLRLPDSLRQQAALARRYGIYGFCFHYYWFSGKSRLETPLSILLANPDIDIPFCVSWANHDWTRNWDGGNREIIQKQCYSPEDDLAFIASLEPYMRDRRYIRINGRPVLLLYKPKLMPEPVATVKRWREYLSNIGIGDPYVIMCHIDEYVDPAGYGMDAAAGFPPNPLGWWLPDMGATTVKLDPKSVGRRLSYDMMASQACALPRTEYTFFHGVCPGWDNEPRQPARGACFLGSSPPSYASWLNHACRRTLDERQGEERIVFINAWNEWGEGAHLEPDRHYGYAYLASTARVLNELDCPANMNTTNPIKPANPEGTESKRIHTSFGSILYIDEMTLKLRHGPILTSPQNVHFVSQGDEGIFKYVSNGISRNIEFKGEHGYAVDSGTIENSSPPATRFVIVRNSSGFLGLKSKEQFLSADPDGEIRINKPHFRKWEYFWLIL